MLEEDCRGVAGLADRLGPLKGLFSSAGLELHGTAETMSLADGSRVIAINLRAIYLLSECTVPLLRQAGGDVP